MNSPQKLNVKLQHHQPNETIMENKNNRSSVAGNNVIDVDTSAIVAFMTPTKRIRLSQCATPPPTKLVPPPTSSNQRLFISPERRTVADITETRPVWTSATKRARVLDRSESPPSSKDYLPSPNRSSKKRSHE
jgi:hypothetical protein